MTTESYKPVVGFPAQRKCLIGNLKRHHTDAVFDFELRITLYRAPLEVTQQSPQINYDSDCGCSAGCGISSAGTQ